MDDTRETRRKVIKKAVYVAPAVLTLTASPAFAQSGSAGPRQGQQGQQGQNRN
jgi:hypothetical protein